MAKKDIRELKSEVLSYLKGNVPGSEPVANALQKQNDYTSLMSTFQANQDLLPDEAISHIGGLLKTYEQGSAPAPSAPVAEEDDGGERTGLGGPKSGVSKSKVKPVPAASLEERAAPSSRSSAPRTGINPTFTDRQYTHTEAELYTVYAMLDGDPEKLPPKNNQEYLNLAKDAVKKILPPDTLREQASRGLYPNEKVLLGKVKDLLGKIELRIDALYVGSEDIEKVDAIKKEFEDYKSLVAAADRWAIAKRWSAMKQSIAGPGGKKTESYKVGGLAYGAGMLTGAALLYALCVKGCVPGGHKHGAKPTATPKTPVVEATVESKLTGTAKYEVHGNKFNLYVDVDGGKASKVTATIGGKTLEDLTAPYEFSGQGPQKVHVTVYSGSKPAYETDVDVEIAAEPTKAATKKPTKAPTTKPTSAPKPTREAVAATPIPAQPTPTPAKKQRGDLPPDQLPD